MVIQLTQHCIDKAVLSQLLYSVPLVINQAIMCVYVSVLLSCL